MTNVRRAIRRLAGLGVLLGLAADGRSQAPPGFDPCALPPSVTLRYQLPHPTGQITCQLDLEPAALSYSCVLRLPGGTRTTTSTWRNFPRQCSGQVPPDGATLLHLMLRSVNDPQVLKLFLVNGQVARVETPVPFDIPGPARVVARNVASQVPGVPVPPPAPPVPRPVVAAPVAAPAPAPPAPAPISSLSTAAAAQAASAQVFQAAPVPTAAAPPAAPSVGDGGGSRSVSGVGRCEVHPNAGGKLPACLGAKVMAYFKMRMACRKDYTAREVITAADAIGDRDCQCTRAADGKIDCAFTGTGQCGPGRTEKLFWHYQDAGTGLNGAVFAATQEEACTRVRGFLATKIKLTAGMGNPAQNVQVSECQCQRNKPNSMPEEQFYCVAYATGEAVIPRL
jgi:hypothetical protein